ncbi:hypothetical protein AAY473_037248 [Plecturocebus cupreus]
MASSVVISISSRGDLETLPQQALARNRVASSIKSSTSRGGDLETLPREDLLRICMASSIKSPTSSGGDLESLPEQLSCVTTWPPPSRAPPAVHDLMACSFTQSMTQSTVAQQSSQEPTVLQARRPEAVLAWPSSSWGCRKAARRCISILMRGPNKPSIITTWPPPWVSPSAVSSTSSGGDLETLAQQALQCNCVVAAYISNKDLETLILQALQHDLMASSFTQSTTQSTVAQQSSQEATVLQARQPETVLARQHELGCARLPGDAFQY